jgi:hypothetical protein
LPSTSSTLETTQSLVQIPDTKFELSSPINTQADLEAVLSRFPLSVKSAILAAVATARNSKDSSSSSYKEMCEQAIGQWLVSLKNPSATAQKGLIKEMWEKGSDIAPKISIQAQDSRRKDALELFQAIADHTTTVELTDDIKDESTFITKVLAPLVKGNDNIIKDQILEEVQRVREENVSQGSEKAIFEQALNHWLVSEQGAKSPEVRAYFNRYFPNVIQRGTLWQHRNADELWQKVNFIHLAINRITPPPEYKNTSNTSSPSTSALGTTQSLAQTSPNSTPAPLPGPPSSSPKND